MSQQLAALQRQAGVTLLERAGRRVALTPTGVALVRHAEVVLAALEAADATLVAARGGLCGTVRIGAYPSAVRTLLLPALVALGRDHPALDLMVTELDPVAVPDALRDRRLDVALVHDYDIVPVEAARPWTRCHCWRRRSTWPSGRTGTSPATRCARYATRTGSWAARARSVTR